MPYLSLSFPSLSRLSHFYLRPSKPQAPLPILWISISYLLAPGSSDSYDMLPTALFRRPSSLGTHMADLSLLLPCSPLPLPDLLIPIFLDTTTNLKLTNWSVLLCHLGETVASKSWSVIPFCFQQLV